MYLLNNKIPCLGLVTAQALKFEKRLEYKKKSTVRILIEMFITLHLVR